MNKRQHIWHITFQDCIYGYVTLGESFEVTSDEQWRELLPLHHWDVPQRPYGRTVAHKVVHAFRFGVPIRFLKKKCAIGTTIFRALALGVEPTSATQSPNQSRSESHDNASDSNHGGPADGDHGLGLEVDFNHGISHSAGGGGSCDVVEDSRFSQVRPRLGLLTVSCQAVCFGFWLRRLSFSQLGNCNCCHCSIFPRTSQELSGVMESKRFCKCGKP